MDRSRDDRRDGARADIDTGTPTTGLSDLQDPALIQACLDGSEAAWSALVMRYERLVYSVPSRLGLDEQSCEDVFQETFCILVRQLPSLRNRRGLPKWLITTAQRVARDIRSRQRTVPDEGRDVEMKGLMPRAQADPAPKPLRVSLEREKG